MDKEPEDMKIKIDKERMHGDLRELAKFSDTPGEGVTRFSYGQNDKNARDYILQECQKYALQARTDAVGNIWISMGEAPKGKKKIITGSHIDSVLHGGAFDGVFGVVAGLEALRRIKETRTNLNHEVVLSIFAEEEGSNFGSTMTGSKFITGIYQKKHLNELITDEGVTLRELLEANGYPVEKIQEVPWNFQEVAAMIELHIEQGPILDRENLEIGIVEAIFGMTVMGVSFQGMGNHAGASPMMGRRDALTCVAEAILEIEKLAQNDKEQRLVATVGKINCAPNVSNVIPEIVEFVVEVRDTDNEKMKEVMEKIVSLCQEIGKRRGLSCSFRKLAESESLPMTESLIDSIEKIARKENLSYKRMNSGAVHDCCMIAKKAKTAMIFVPSIAGRSHVPFELTKQEHLEIGAQLLLDTILEIDKDLSR